MKKILFVFLILFLIPTVSAFICIDGDDEENINQPSASSYFVNSYTTEFDSGTHSQANDYCLNDDKLQENFCDDSEGYANAKVISCSSIGAVGCFDGQCIKEDTSCRGSSDCGPLRFCSIENEKQWFWWECIKGECMLGAGNCYGDNTCINQECESITKYRCGNGKVDSGETCSSCPIDIKCPSETVCKQNSCVAPCVGVDCEDNNDCTDDRCNPSNSQCEHTIKQSCICIPGQTCKSTEGCDGAMDCSTKTCISNLKKCPDGICKPSCDTCTKNSECDDKQDWTKDTCQKGTTGNFCENKLISGRCESDSDCTDQECDVTKHKCGGDSPPYLLIAIIILIVGGLGFGIYKLMKMR